MKQKIRVRAAALGLLFMAGAAGAFAQVTVGGALRGQLMNGVKVIGEGYPKADPGGFYGGIIQADFWLPVNAPVSLGAQIGVGQANFTISAEGKTYKETIRDVPIFARLAYHLYLSFEDMLGEFYAVGKIGYAFGFWEGGYKTMVEQNGASLGHLGGLAFEVGGGAAASLSRHGIFIGWFVEICYANHALEGKLSGNGFNQTVRVSYDTSLVFGISVTFDKSGKRFNAKRN
jgi:hypothetical protein